MGETGRSIEVTRTYLEMTARPPSARADLPGARIETAAACTPSFFRYLYREVGQFYHWIDRLEWTDGEIRGHLARPGISLYVLYSGGTPAGYFELQKHEDGSTEIAYFGLIPEFTGRGLGRYLLVAAIEQAWETGASRVWLHTCTLDDPAAMPNYLKRGFKPFKRETYFTTISPDEQLRVNV
ncbi:MAG TPA: GNAT family N-acetyltransferase [Blastocatellia bacterium]|nr:GNAT family N-acetyltransferase [Blastocatellia bacterium]